MKKKTIKYFVKFYFWTLLFFIELWFYSIIKKKPQDVPVPVSTEINLLDGDQAVLAEKPSVADAVRNKAILGLSTMPKDKKKKLVIGIIVLVYLILFGVVNTFYWIRVLIGIYPIIGTVLLYSVCLYILYLLLRSTYRYFKNGKYKLHLMKLRELWSEAKMKSEKKLQVI